WHFARMNEDLPFAADFAPGAHADWLKLVAAALKGAPFEKLVARTHDGLRIAPLYSGKADARPLAARAPGTAWQVMQRVDHPDPAAANVEALHDLENGANGLALVCAGAIGCYGHGLAAAEGALARVLDGVLLDAGVSIELDPGPQAEDTAVHLASLVERRGI